MIKNLYWKDMISPHFANDKLCYDVFDFKDQTQCHVTVWDAPRGNNTQHIPCFGFQILWTWYEIINHKHGVFEVKRKALCRADQVHFTGEKFTIVKHSHIKNILGSAQQAGERSDTQNTVKINSIGIVEKSYLLGFLETRMPERLDSPSVEPIANSK